MYMWGGEGVEMGERVVEEEKGDEENKRVE